MSGSPRGREGSCRYEGVPGWCRRLPGQAFRHCFDELTIARRTSRNAGTPRLPFQLRFLRATNTPATVLRQPNPPCGHGDAAHQLTTPGLGPQRPGLCNIDQFSKCGTVIGADRVHGGNCYEEPGLPDGPNEDTCEPSITSDPAGPQYPPPPNSNKTTTTIRAFRDASVEVAGVNPAGGGSRQWAIDRRVRHRRHARVVRKVISSCSVRREVRGIPRPLILRPRRR